MSISNTPQEPTPNLESLRKAIEQFQPSQRRVPFSNLKAVHDAIVELRGKRASYSIIAELLQQHGVKTSRARVAEYGRIVLEGRKSRGRRKRTVVATANTATPQSVPPAPSTTSPVNHVEPPPNFDSPRRPRGPHIAHIRLAKPISSQASILEGSPKPGDTPKA